ncbi:MAG: hypothetical protein IKV10_02140 [Alphaproteobacteria bacterium]|nr:hypothetical protein [Alphaproteobacteria bacterium]
MRYPDEFNTPTFPAGPRIALSRVVAIATMVVFALILAVGGGIYWASKSRHIHPFLVTIDDITGSWQVVGHDHGEPSITKNRAMQESLIANFIKNWFTISANPTENDDLWSSFDNADKCDESTRPTHAPIFCAGSVELYSKFVNNVQPDYQVRVANGETWSVDVDNIYLNEVNVTDTGGTWRALFEIDSNKQEPIQVIAYITLKHSAAYNPGTLGFYVASFNTYNIGNK